MNNPLNRSMFRQAGMSKQPMGILASSPELMTTAQKAMVSGQPMKSQRGNFISTAPTVGFGLNNQPYIPLNQQVTNPNLPTVRNVNQEKRDLYKAKPSGFSKKNSGIQTVGTSNLSTDNSLLSQYMNKESPLSAFGDEGRKIDKAVSTPLSYLLAGEKSQQAQYDKAGVGATDYYESLRNQDMEGGDTSVQKSNVDPNAINTSTKTALEKALIMVDQTKLREQKLENEAIVEDETAISGEAQKTETKASETKASAKAKTYNLSSNVTNDNSSDNKNILNLTKIIGNAKSGSNEQKTNSKKIDIFLANALKNNDISKATDANLIASGGADPETINDMSDEDKAIKLKERIKTMFGKDADQMGLESDLEGMNLIMLGLRIAAGESPNAMTNIAKGALGSLNDIAEQKKEKLAKMEKIDALVVSTILGREDKELDQKNRKEIVKIDQKHDISKLKIGSALTMAQDLQKMKFENIITDKKLLHSKEMKGIDVNLQSQRLKTQMIMQSDRIQSSEKIALANIQSSFDRLGDTQEHQLNVLKIQNEMNLEKAALTNMPKGYTLGLLEGKKKGLTGDDLANYAATTGLKFSKARVLTGGETLKVRFFGIVENLVKDGIPIDKAMSDTLNNENFQKFFKPELSALGLSQVPVSSKTTKDLGLGDLPEGTVLGQDGKAWTSGTKFVVGAGGIIEKG